MQEECFCNTAEAFEAFDDIPLSPATDNFAPGMPPRPSVMAIRKKGGGKIAT